MTPGRTKRNETIAGRLRGKVNTSCDAQRDWNDALGIPLKTGSRVIFLEIPGFYEIIGGIIVIVSVYLIQLQDKYSKVLK